MELVVECLADPMPRTVASHSKEGSRGYVIESSPSNLRTTSLCLECYAHHPKLMHFLGDFRSDPYSQPENNEI